MLEIEKSETKLKEIKKSHKEKRCSHLYLQDKCLKAVPKLSASKDMNVIYLFNNEISTIDNLHGNLFPNVVSLYLQNNKIEKIENLSLKKLKKLYLNFNKISVLEGFENLYNLEELHIEKQSLPDGIALCIDPRSIINLSRTLRVLNISNNKIASFLSLIPLIELQNIDASNCDLEDLQEVCETIRNWRYLSVASFSGNPFSKNHRYREEIIANSYYLESLDGKEVSDNTRIFLKRLKTNQLTHKAAANTVNLADIVSSLPKNYPPPLQKAVSAQILKGNKFQPLRSTSVDESDISAYIAWQGLPKRRPFVAKKENKTVNNIENSIIVNKVS